MDDETYKNKEVSSSEDAKFHERMDQLAILPPEIVSSILRNLDGPSLIRVAKFSDRWRNVIYNDVVLRSQIKQPQPNADRRYLSGCSSSHGVHNSTVDVDHGQLPGTDSASVETVIHTGSEIGGSTRTSRQNEYNISRASSSVIRQEDEYDN